MNLKHLGIVVIVGLLLSASSGCDTGRAAFYRVAFDRPAVVGAVTAGQLDAEDRLKQLVRETLAGKGFKEKPGSRHVWRKRGAWVAVYWDKRGDLILEVGAFGSRRDVRVSRQTEQELVAILKERLGLELSPVTPSQASTH